MVVRKIKRPLYVKSLKILRIFIFRQAISLLHHTWWELFQDIDRSGMTCLERGISWKLG